MMNEPMPSAVADHGYHCPKCEAPMATFQRSMVTVERCTECRGIFLDRGELERLLDMEAAPPRAADGYRAAGGWDRRSERHDDADDDDDAEEHRGRRRGWRRGGFLDDLLDAFGD